jgi:hypothetical protein
VEIPFLIALDRKIIRSVPLVNREVKQGDGRNEVPALFQQKPNSEVLIEAKSPLPIAKPPLCFQVPH